MASKTYAIMGATGNIGSQLTLELLKLGHKVNAIGRSQHKLSILQEKGAQGVIIRDFDDAGRLNVAFQDVDAVFSFIPPGYSEKDLETYQEKIGKAIKAALEKNQIRYVVNLSSVGAELTQGTGPIKGLHRHEMRLNSLSNNVNILHLRPAFFMENLFSAIPFIIKNGIFEGALFGHLRIPMVATNDIAAKAAYFLDRLNFKGHTIFDLVGPRPVTYSEVARILGKAIGRPELKYVEVAYSDAEKAMVALGMNPSMARLMTGMYEAFNKGLIKPTQTITPEHQGKTTIEEFALLFAEKYKESE
jgi:uncharacterized protein YbjT (DUF2867 family)